MQENGWLGLDGSRVLVAGAGGIGTACAIGYAQQGAAVFLVDRDGDRVASAIEAVQEAAPDAKVAGLDIDLTESDSGARAVDRALTTIGGLDVALHAIGVNDRRPLIEFSREEWESIQRVNLGSAFEIVQAAGRHFVEQKRGLHGSGCAPQHRVSRTAARAHRRR
ncbi:MAG: SDR family oxidoreductase [Microbacterium sp.]